MQSVKHNGLPHPLSIHLEPEEVLKRTVKVEFSLQQIPCMPDPTVSCYEHNGCVVLEGYCPADSQNPFSGCGGRNTLSGSKRQQDRSRSRESGGTETPYNPLVLWDVIPRLIHDLISGSGLKVPRMDERKLPPGVKNLPTGSSLREDPNKTSHSGFKDESVSADILKQWDRIDNLEGMNEQEMIHGERERPTLIFPLITPIVRDSESSEDVDITPDPFKKRQWQTVGNTVEAEPAADNAGTPAINMDTTGTKSSEALLDAADQVTEHKWVRRGALTQEVMSKRARLDSATSNEDRVSTVLSAYTNSVRLQRRDEEDRKKETDSMSVSISETESGDIEVALSDLNVYNSAIRLDEEGDFSHADVACGTGRIDEDASQCVLCGSSLRHRKRDQRARYTKQASATGRPTRAMMGASSHASAVQHTQKQTDKNVRKEVTPHPMKTNQGQPPRGIVEESAYASGTAYTQHSKERNMRQDIKAYPVIINQGEVSKAMMDAPTHTSTAEHKHHHRDKHKREETTAHLTKTSSSKPFRVTMDVGTSMDHEAPKPVKKDTEAPKVFEDDQNVAVYRVSAASSSKLKPASKTNKDVDKTQCTMQHILFPKDACPYSPSLTSLPLDESDIEYIIRRAQLARSVLPPDEWTCPKERWQHRSQHRQSSKSARSRSSG